MGCGCPWLSIQGMARGWVGGWARMCAFGSIVNGMFKRQILCMYWYSLQLQRTILTLTWYTVTAGNTNMDIFSQPPSFSLHSMKKSHHCGIDSISLKSILVFKLRYNFGAYAIRTCGSVLCQVREKPNPAQTWWRAPWKVGLSSSLSYEWTWTWTELLT